MNFLIPEIFGNYIEAINYLSFHALPSFYTVTDLLVVQL